MLCMQSAARWEANFHELRRYKEEFGNTDVPFKWRDPTYDFNNEFAKWYHAQPDLFRQRRLSVAQVTAMPILYMLLTCCRDVQEDHCIGHVMLCADTVTLAAGSQAQVCWARFGPTHRRCHQCSRLC